MTEGGDEHKRLNEVYNRLRLKLLDLTKRNRMLSYSLSPKSKKHLQIVDEVLEEIYKKLVEANASLRINPLEEPDDIPAEERSEDFIEALEGAKVSDIEYLTKLQALENTGHDDEFEIIKLERQLRDRVRIQLGLPPRPRKSEINLAEHARQNGIDPNFELQPTKTKPSHTDQALQTLKFPDDVERIMGKIVADARLAEQEMGISTLFLAFGFLEWYESEDSDKKAFAPLLLLPVRVEAKKVHGKTVYSIAATEETAEANLSLQKLLETNFDRTLPAFETLDEESSGSIEGYLDLVRTAIKNLKRWDVHRWLVLGHFAFGRFAMYADLNPEHWPGGPLGHSIVGSILRGTDEIENERMLLSDPDDYLIDAPDIETIAPIVIQDADASQHSALVDVMKGHNLVIQGPPGTGKSQTISNIIAAALAAGNTVLFVAEKQAALDVVKRKLERSGLGEFCLELHSDKAAPKLVIESLKARRSIKSVATPAMQDTTWRETRKEITGYLNALHSKQDDGQTPFDLIWAALRGKTTHGDVLQAFRSAKLPDSILVDPVATTAAQDQMDVFAAATASFTESFGHPVESPWNRTPLGNVLSYQANDLVDQLRGIARTAQGLLDCIVANTQIGVSTLNDLTAIIAVEAALGQPPDQVVVGNIAALEKNELSRVLWLKRELHELNDALAARPHIGEQDLSLFVNASKIPDLGLSDVLMETTPAELARIAKETIHRNTTLKAAIDDFRPALESFGADGSYPMNRLDILAIAVLASVQIPEQYQSSMRAHLAIDEEQFAELYAKWLRLREAEKCWRARLPAHGHQSWPQSSSISQAAAILKKKWFRKAMAGLDGSAKEARRIVENLGFDDTGITSGDVERLAAHIDTFNEFESDEEAAALFGASWHGFATPFEEIANGLRARQVLTDQIGPDATQRLIRVPCEAVPALNRHVDAARQLHHALQDLEDLVDQGPVDLVVDKWANEITIMTTVFALIGQWDLPALKAPIREIAEIAKLRLRAHQVGQTLDGSPLKYAVEDLGRSVARIDRAFAALNWIRAVSEVPMPTLLLKRLTSSAASEERARLKTAAEQASQLHAEHCGLVDTLVNDFGMTGYADLELAELSKSAATLIERATELPEFLALISERRKLISVGLGDFISRADEYRIEPPRLTQILTALVADRRADMARKTSPEMVKNTGATLNTRRKQFAEKDRAKIENNRLIVKEKLLTRKPLPGSSYGKKKDWTEMALINAEIEKQKRFVPVRSLLARAGKSIRALKPCFMMSPLSLAKFMKPGSLSFDLLVIDEASQMRPEDALGAIFRSKQIVVVGDPNQLPPTDFFNRSMNADFDEEADDLDDESILDSCQKTFGQRRSLKWHYRSQCESLIRFSNENFYRHGLITFPVAKPGSFSIDLVRVNGTYQARCNAAEATCIAEHSVLFMRHHADANDDDIPTLGIVAVNTEQRDLIQEELRRMMADDPQVDKYREKVEKKGEDLFVKNLENVQGDERDFIFISMTYGFEPGAAAMKQRFGPINGKQGHRRLNVLFSRARMRIGLFTSFGSIDVAPTEASADGVHILRRYLEYAEVRGRSAADGASSGPESDFEAEVADRLRAKKFVVDYQVGVSKYRIDLGVRHPEFPEQYLVGIECDGARYHSSKSARDRDRIREEVLQSKGWSLIRVWSTDWFENADIQTDRLVQKIAECCKKPPSSRIEYPSLATMQPASQDTSPTDEVPAPADARAVEPAASQSEPLAPSSADMSPEEQCLHDLNHLRDEIIRVEIDNWQPHRSILRSSMIEAFIRQKVVDPSEWFLKIPSYLRQGTNPIEKRYLEQICDIVARLGKARQPSPDAPMPPLTIQADVRQPPPSQQQFPFGNGSKAPAEIGVSRKEYVLASFVSDLARPDAFRFYDPDYKSTLARMIEHVIKVEAPIYEDLLIERIARAHGFQRSGEKIQAIVSRVVHRKFPKTEDDGRTVIWPENARTAEPYPYRESPAEIRPQQDIPIAELASLALPFVRLLKDDDGVLYSMTDHFKLGRLREATRIRFQAAIAMAREMTMQSSRSSEHRPSSSLWAGPQP